MRFEGSRRRIARAMHGIGQSKRRGSIPHYGTLIVPGPTTYSGQHGGTITIGSGGGTPVTPPYTGPFECGQDLILEAHPNSGYTFDHWVINGTSYMDNPLVYDAPCGPLDITPVFAIINPVPTYFSPFGGTPEGSGEVSIDGLTHGLTYALYTPKGVYVTLLATPTGGYRFNEWDLSGPGTKTANPIVYHITANSNNVLVQFIAT